jgi:hypothetical protein
MYKEIALFPYNYLLHTEYRPAYSETSTILQNCLKLQLQA